MEEDLGPLARAAIDQAPDIMRELTEQFIARKDLNSRVRLRLRMKAVLDLISVDTEYPAVPALNPRQEPAGDGQGQGGPGAFALRHEMAAVPQAVAAIPGAEQAGDNDIVLGG